MAATSFKRSLFTTASPKYDDFLVGNAAYIPNSFESIATATPSGTNTVTFSSIPSTYKHLQLRCNNIFAQAGRYIYLQFNSDTGSNYTNHILYGFNATVGASGNTATTNMRTSVYANGSVITYPTVSIIDIADYANTSKNKTVKILSGTDNNTTTDGEIDLISGAWLSTSAINSITITTNSGNLNSGSSIALYGIKG